MKLKSLLLGAVASALVLATSTAADLGIQTWTLRNMEFDQVVAFAKKHGIKNLQVIGKHIDPNSPREEYLKKKAVLDQNGLRAYTFGVAGTSLDKEKHRKLFTFAKDMGIQLIIVEPTSPSWRRSTTSRSPSTTTASAPSTAIRWSSAPSSSTLTRTSACAWTPDGSRRRAWTRSRSTRTTTAACSTSI